VAPCKDLAEGILILVAVETRRHQFHPTKEGDKVWLNGQSYSKRRDGKESSCTLMGAYAWQIDFEISGHTEGEGKRGKDKGSCSLSFLKTENNLEKRLPFA